MIRLPDRDRAALELSLDRRRTAMKRFIPLVAAVAFLLMPGQEAEAQMGVDFGPELYYNAESEDFGVGARVELSPPMFPVGFIVNGDYIFVDCGDFDCSAWDFGASAKYTISLPGAPIGPYLGAGLTHQRATFEGETLSDTGFHILGGLRLGGMLPFGAFLEGRYLVMEENQFVINLGILF
jgi:hypothetical protein